MKNKIMEQFFNRIEKEFGKQQAENMKDSILTDYGDITDDTVFKFLLDFYIDEVKESFKIND